MAIEIIRLTDRGIALSHSVRRSNDIGWNAIYFLGKNGLQSTKDRICQYCYNGNESITNSVLKRLKAENIVVGV